MSKTKYESFMSKSDECLEKAISESDENLRMFYKNASDGYKMKARNLSLDEAASIEEDK